MQRELHFGCVEIDLIVRMEAELGDRFFRRQQVGIFAADKISRGRELVVQGDSCAQENGKGSGEKVGFHLEAEALSLRDSVQIF